VFVPYGQAPQQRHTRQKAAGTVANKRLTSDMKAQIASKLYAAFEVLSADAELLSTVRSWRDTVNVAEVLSMLR
jgi:hypothetical protein